MKILIMGLPGSGKTTLAGQLVNKLRESDKTVLWLNADNIRKLYNDWDFSYVGRIRQATRMYKLASVSEDDYVVCDFVAPLQEMRDIFKADFTVWMDTIKESRYENTNKEFSCPVQFELRITEQDSKKWSVNIVNLLINCKK